MASIAPTEYGKAGGLIGYGICLAHLARRSMAFRDRIVKGA
jgi:hypothetical protein